MAVCARKFLPGDTEDTGRPQEYVTDLQFIFWLRKITKQKVFSGLDEGLQLFYIASVYKFFILHNIFFLNRV